MQPSGTPTDTIAERVRGLRRARRWSAQRLAEEMSKVGVEWNRGVVTKLENGRRESVSVVEWLALAYALNVSPLSLVTPQNDQVTIQVTPAVSLTGEDLGRWIAGQEPRSADLPPFEGTRSQPFDWRRELPGWRLAELIKEHKTREAGLRREWDSMMREDEGGGDGGQSEDQADSGR